MLALKSLKRQVSLNPPKMANLLSPLRQKGDQDGPTDRTAKLFNILAGSDRQGCDDGAASAASVIQIANGVGSFGRILAPFNGWSG